MIYVGSQGSMNFYYNDKLCCSSPLSKNKTIDLHYKETNQLIRHGLEEGWSLNEIKNEFIQRLENFVKIKKYNRTREHEKYMVMAFMMLIRLKVYDFDDVCLVMPKKKGLKV